MEKKQLTKRQSEFWLAGLRAVKKEENRFEMSEWFSWDELGEGACGTSACFAGHLEIQRRHIENKYFQPQKSSDMFDKLDEEIDTDLILRRLGFTEDQIEWGCENNLFHHGFWNNDAVILYKNGEKVEALLNQVRFIFREYELEPHPDYVEQFKEILCQS